MFIREFVEGELRRLLRKPVGQVGLEPVALLHSPVMLRCPYTNGVREFLQGNNTLCATIWAFWRCSSERVTRYFLAGMVGS